MPRTHFLGLIGIPMLAGIGVEANDRSFAMSLDTTHFAHSITLGPHANQITLIPILASKYLLPVPQNVVIEIFLNEHRVPSTGKTSFSNSPSINHPLYALPLSA